MNSDMKFGDHSLSITLAMSKSHSALHYIPHPVENSEDIKKSNLFLFFSKFA